MNKYIVVVGITFLMIVSVIFFYKGFQDKLSKDCSKQAEVVLKNEQMNKKGQNDSYRQINHYNKELKKCLVKIDVTMPVSESVLLQSEVRDAFEGKSFIVCYSGGVNFCQTFDDTPGSMKNLKLNNTEGSILISSYMEN